MFNELLTHLFNHTDAYIRPFQKVFKPARLYRNTARKQIPNPFNQEEERNFPRVVFTA